MHALVLHCINQYTKFEVPSFTNYKDMTGAKFKKRGDVTPTTPFYGWFVTVDYDLVQSTCMQNWTILFSRSTDIILGVQI